MGIRTGCQAMAIKMLCGSGRGFFLARLFYTNFTNSHLKFQVWVTNQILFLNSSSELQFLRLRKISTKWVWLESSNLAILFYIKTLEVKNISPNNLYYKYSLQGID